jgi:hypothetical protein
MAAKTMKLKIHPDVSGYDEVYGVSPTEFRPVEVTPEIQLWIDNRMFITPEYEEEQKKLTDAARAAVADGTAVRIAGTIPGTTAENATSPVGVTTASALRAPVAPAVAVTPDDSDDRTTGGNKKRSG